MPTAQPEKDYTIYDRAMPLTRDISGWLATAYKDPETLRILIEAGASREDQHDKNEALKNAAARGPVDSVRALIAYGALSSSVPLLPPR